MEDVFLLLLSFFAQGQRSIEIIYSPSCHSLHIVIQKCHGRCHDGLGADRDLRSSRILEVLHWFCVVLR